MSGSAKVTKPGTVKKIVPVFDSREPDKAEIQVHDAEALFDELRIPNSLEDGDVNQLRLKKGAPVEVHIEADKAATVPKKGAA